MLFLSSFSDYLLSIVMASANSEQLCKANAYAKSVLIEGKLGWLESTGSPTRQGNHFCMNAETESLGLGEVWLLESCVSGNKETKEIETQEEACD